MIKSFVGGFFSWWGGELRSLYPNWLSRALSSNIVHVSLAVGVDAGWSVTRAIGPWGQYRALASGSWPEVRGCVLRHCRAYGAFTRVSVSVPVEACLKRQITIPAQALGQAQKIATNDLEHRTPFAPSNTYLAHQTTQGVGGEWMVEQTVLKRSKIELAVSDLESAGVVVSGVFATESVGDIGVNLLDGGHQRRSRFERFLLVAAALSAFVLASLAGIFTVTSFNNQAALISEIDSQLASVRKKTLALQKQLTTRQSQQLSAKAALLRKLDQVTPIEVWSELTRLLPETAWVREIQLNGRELRIMGFASAPEELIARLSSSPIFKHARFTAPLTRVANSQQEQFQMQIEIGPRHSVQQQVSRRKPAGKLQ